MKKFSQRENILIVMGMTFGVTIVTLMEALLFAGESTTVLGTNVIMGITAGFITLINYNRLDKFPK